MKAHSYKHDLEQYGTTGEHSYFVSIPGG